MKNIIYLIALTPLLLHGQTEELKQRTSLFLQEQSETFKIKELNGSEPDYGILKETQFIFHQYYQLKQIDKEINELGNSVRPKYDLSTFAYEDEEELKYALKFWFKEFIGHKRIHHPCIHHVFIIPCAYFLSVTFVFLIQMSDSLNNFRKDHY